MSRTEKLEWKKLEMEIENLGARVAALERQRYEDPPPWVDVNWHEEKINQIIGIMNDIGDIIAEVRK